MKKKIVLCILTASVLISLAGCGLSGGISQSDYDAVLSERDAAQAELDELKENTVSKEEYDAVVAERDELKQELESSDDAESSEETTADEEDETKEVKVGDSFEAKGLNISIDSSDLEYWTYDTYYDEQVYGQGMKYVGVSVSVENTGDSEQNISVYDFDCYADNALCDRASFYEGKYGSVSAGRSTSFVAYWKVPENAGEIEVEYSYRENFTDKMVKIKLQ